MARKRRSDATGGVVEDCRGKVVRFAIRYRIGDERRYERVDVATREEAQAILADRLAGAPAPARQKPPFLAVLKNSIGPDEACWPWQGVIGAQRGEAAYGKHGGRWVHRRVYEHLVGPVPLGHDLHHTCETKSCVNPAHLEVLTHGEHTRVTQAGHRNGQRPGSSLATNSGGAAAGGRRT
jgi:hypothetical protein